MIRDLLHPEANPLATLTALKEHLAEDVLDPAHEVHGRRFSRHIHVGPNYPWVWRFQGDFLYLPARHPFDLSFTFANNFSTRDPEWLALESLSHAIRSNQETPEYQAARQRQWPLLPGFAAAAWLNRNVRQASDPPFEGTESLTPYATFTDLAEDLYRASWCAGSGFFCNTIALVCTAAGCEYLVIKNDRSFESFTVPWIKQDELLRLLTAADQATPAACRDLTYASPSPVG